MDYLEFITRVTSHIPDKGQVAFGGGTDFSLQNEFPIKLNGEKMKKRILPVLFILLLVIQLPTQSGRESSDSTCSDKYLEAVNYAEKLS